MSIWKSPVFYFGILLVMAVVGALVAPFVIDWNSYRANLEGYGHKITGRGVAINGPIKVRLFPFPTLEMNDLAIANPPGFSGPAMAEVKKLTAHLNFGGLFSGEIRVDAMDVEAPVLNLARNQKGEGNWHFVPDAALSSSKLLDKVQLNGINIKAGRIHASDEASGREVVLDHLEGLIAAPALQGPWRANGMGAWGDMPVQISWSSAAWAGEGPFKFGVHLVPQDGQTPALVLDGAQEAGHFKGTVNLQPAARADGRQGLDGQFKPLQAQAKLDASFDALDFDAIRIVPADEKDTGTLIEGKAHLDLVDGLKADVALNSPHIDLDTLAGTQSLRVWRAGGVMGLLNSVLADFPEKLGLSGQLDVAALSAAGETLQNVHLVSTAEQNDIRIKDFSADLPGRSRMKFNGIVFPGAGAAELGGSLAFESNDAREFTQWLWPEGKQGLASVWTGQRGRLKAQADVTWTGKQFGFQNLNYELDGEQGKADLAVVMGALPAIKLQLDAGAVDVESYIKGGLLGLLQGGAGSLLQNADGVEKRLQLTAKTLALNGVVAKDVSFDFDSSASGFEIKKLDIGAVDGAKLSGQGLVLNGPDGPSGHLNFDMGADRFSAVMQMLGVLAKGPEPQWMRSLGASQFAVGVDVKPGATEPALNYDINGHAGEIGLVANGNLKNLNAWPKSELGVAAEFDAKDGVAFAKLLGPTLPADGKSGHVTLTASGNMGSEFATAVVGQGYGADWKFEGKSDLTKGLGGLSGKFAVAAAEANALAQLAGLPVALEANKRLSIEGNIEPQKLSTVTIKLGEAVVNAEASQLDSGEVSARFSGGKMSLGEILGMAFLPWNGLVSGLDASLSDGPIFGFSGTVDYQPDQLDVGLGPDLPKPKIEFDFSQKMRRFKISGAGPSLEFAVKPQGLNYALRGAGAIDFNLGDILRQSEQDVILDGKAHALFDFNALSRSPAGLLASMQGSGELEYSDGKLLKFSPQQFFAGLSEVKDSAGLQDRFKVAVAGAGSAIGNGKSRFEINQGTASFSPVKNDQAGLSIAPSYDLPNDIITLEATGSAVDQSDLPPFKVTYRGAPGALSEKDDFNALSSKLGYGFIARDMAELDRVKQEQEKLSAEQAAQAEADAEKFAAYQAQRAELRQRLREMKVHAAQRLIDAARYKAGVDQAVAAGQAMVKAERQKFLRMWH